MAPNRQSAPWMDGASPPCHILRLPNEVLHTILKMTLEHDLTFYHNQTDIAWSTLSIGYALDTDRLLLEAEDPGKWSERSASTILKALKSRPGRCHAVKRVIFYHALGFMVRQSPHSLPLTGEEDEFAKPVNPKNIEAHVRDWPVTKLTLEGGMTMYGKSYASMRKSAASLLALPSNLDEDKLYMRNLDKLIVRGFQVAASLGHIYPPAEMKVKASTPVSGDFLRQCTNIKVLRLIVQDGRSPFSGNVAGLGVHSNRDLAESLEHIYLPGENVHRTFISVNGFTLWNFSRLRILTLSPYFILLTSKYVICCGDQFASPRLDELEFDYSGSISGTYDEIVIETLKEKSAMLVESCRNAVAVSLPSMALKR
ncbi:uncharacterized protein J7T54_006986 [Emericellopsis cladophorae]|uniref:Uncharacterized protein n=1 Tax=Emericellopsis cladophorae TaxID=2686198 RepID=A0A9Q0BI99_9HYPO|nr:uncharacterized protein J7T54_006986 [Emericellopsis cladophorae]KAI6785344.1 hypothetical protein J7T54_006986 [Emericellopsis cladophorae]